MPSKPRTRLAAALTAAAAIGATSLTATSATADPVIPKASGNVVVEWNRTLLSLVQTPGAQPATIHPTRDFAIMSAGIAIDPFGWRCANTERSLRTTAT